MSSPRLYPALILAVYGLVSIVAPSFHDVLAQEDGPVEWLTVGLFAGAALLFGSRAARGGWRAYWCHAAVAAFCLFVAGEEVSWGQRFLGIVPPKAFLAYNRQQETNLHNLLSHVLSTNWQLILLLAGWGVLLPILVSFGAHRRAGLPESSSEVSPAPSLALWAAAGAALVSFYPVELTAEYVELLAGCLFLQTAWALPERWPRARWALAAPLLVAAAGFAATEAQAALGREAKSACARLEAERLAAAIAGGAARSRLLKMKHVHHRLFAATKRGYLREGLGGTLEGLACPGAASSPERRSYLIDPWGQAYWLRWDVNDGTAEVYSFGPNRRRDGGDDVLVPIPVTR